MIAVTPGQPTESEEEPKEPDPRAEEFAWREQALLRAGYTPDDAISIAHRLDIDLHRALDLISKCDPLVAAHILL